VIFGEVGMGDDVGVGLGVNVGVGLGVNVGVVVGSKYTLIPSSSSTRCIKIEKSTIIRDVCPVFVSFSASIRM